ncbi:MAG: ABC transporter permease [Candidatus Acidiferrales bacterium]
MNFNRILAMMKKEVLQIRRDPRSLLIILLMPVLQLFIYGYALNLDVHHVPLCIYDEDGTQFSQYLVNRFSATNYFDIVHVAGNYRDVVQQIDSGNAVAALVIPPRFTETIHSGQRATVQLILDASDSNSASVALGYVQSIVANYSAGVAAQWAQSHNAFVGPPPVNFQARTWFNEDLQSAATFVPGVVAMVMAVVGAFLTSLTIAREWERGTMEQLISTPVGRMEIEIGKLTPYFVIGMVDTALCAVAAVYWFDVPFRGSWIVLFGSSALFLIVVLSLGYYISVVAKSQLAASQMALMATFLPTFLLSGFLFPLEQMPVAVQIIGRALPAVYFVSILREVFLKGTAFRQMGPQLGALAIYMVILLTLATRAFHKRLE